MAFDWEMFLDSNGVEIGRRRRRNVSVQCPWCADDPSYHLSINLDGRGYHCWRNDSHAGTSPASLIMALLGCSYSQAAAIAEQRQIPLRVSDDDFADDMLTRMSVRTHSYAAQPAHLEMLPEFRRIEDHGLCATLIFPYLRKRGYNRTGALKLASRFDLQWAARGHFAYRLIMPIKINGQLVTWTSRTVTTNKLRYMTLSQDPKRAAEHGLPAALASIKECLYDYDNLQSGGQTLVVTEGPFDAMRVSFLGESRGIRATCLFSKSALPAQLALLLDLANRYDEVVVLLDADVGLSSFETLPSDICRTVRLPAGVPDPAELDASTFRQLFPG